MFKLNRWFGSFFLIAPIFFFIACDKEDVIDNITSNDGIPARLAYIDKGYTEVEVNPIVKIICYFSYWDKDILTPVSGSYDYYDSDDNWVASIDFGDGICDEWATKTWDVGVFPDYPSGTNEFSIFDSKDNK